VPDESIYESFLRQGYSRREFLKYCGLAAGAIALVGTPLGKAADVFAGDPTGTVAAALETKSRLPVIWLELQNCAGCVEAFTRSAAPSAADLLLNSIALDYSETLMAAAGTQAEENKRLTIEKYKGKYLLVCDGSVSTGNAGYCTVGGKSSEFLVKQAAAGAAAVVANGTCAAFGGLPLAKPDPTGAKTIAQILPGTTVVNIPGCPAIPEVFTGTLFNFVVFGKLPELDDLNRPKTFYADTIHARCVRRQYYDAGKFAASFDDRGAREGYCLYKLGCKGPTTYNSCASMRWMEGLSYPIQSGHPCLGCSQPDFWDAGGFYASQSAPIDTPTWLVAGAALAAGAVAGVAAGAAGRARKNRPTPELLAVSAAPRDVSAEIAGTPAADDVKPAADDVNSEEQP
jgi:hydrogenase small subunit